MSDDNSDSAPVFVNGDTDSDNELDVQETWVYSAAHVVTQEEMDLGDAVEHSDTPGYPERYSGMAMRTFINYILYSMTH